MSRPLVLAPLALAFALALVAPPAAATYPHLSDPFQRSVGVPGLAYDVHLSDHEIVFPTVPQVCVHRNLLCVGPTTIDPIYVGPPGDEYVWFMYKDAQAHVTYDERRWGETGPWIVEVGGLTLNVCQMRCFVPMWANVTVKITYMVTHYDNGRDRTVMDTLVVDSNALLHPVVRPYDPNNPYGQPKRVPADLLP